MLLGAFFRCISGGDFTHHQAGHSSFGNSRSAAVDAYQCNRRSCACCFFPISQTQWLQSTLPLSVSKTVSACSREKHCSRRSTRVLAGSSCAPWHRMAYVCGLHFSLRGDATTNAFWTRVTLRPGFAT
jgi:hypothetical protein